MDYKAIYLRLFNKVTDAVGLLQRAQLEGEEAYIEGTDANIVMLDAEKDRVDDDF